MFAFGDSYVTARFALHNGDVISMRLERSIGSLTFSVNDIPIGCPICDCRLQQEPLSAVFMVLSGGALTVCDVIYSV